MNDKKYEKLFETGKIGLEKNKGKHEAKKFKVIIDHGELYVECIDSFEEIFEISHKLVFPNQLDNQNENRI